MKLDRTGNMNTIFDLRSSTLGLTTRGLFLTTILNYTKAICIIICGRGADMQATASF